MRIAVMDGTFAMRPFINRLAAGLSTQHDVAVLGFNERLTSPLPGVEYVGLGPDGNRFQLLARTGRLALAAARHRGTFSPLTASIRLLIKRDRAGLRAANLQNFVTSWRPDILHVQWVSLLPTCEGVLSHPGCAVVLSQRGFHTYIRPWVDESFRTYQARVLPKLAGFHSVSRHLEETGDAIANFPGKINQVVYSGLDLSSIPYSREAAERRAGPFQFVSVGRPHWVKGYEIALAACRLLKDRGFDFRYTILGAAGSEELLYSVRDMDLEAEVTLLAAVPQAKAWEIIRGSNLMISPSLMEGVSNSVLEAMALGTPVLSSDCGGMPEVIKHARNGWIVPLRSPGAIAAEITRIAGLEPSEVEEIRRAARAHVEEQHSTASLVAGIEGLYRKILASSKGG